MKYSRHSLFCYIQLQAIAQDSQWLALANRDDVSPEMKTHLGDVLHYLGEAMDCIEPFIETTTDQRVQSETLLDECFSKSSPLGNNHITNPKLDRARN
ncbi:hypothetical protein [Nostoc sp. CCY 9925]|uniref:hypothetical protein n=1 Tax=Nostoc sp. CCY 9925 TaxID=3103865 RepID=UPI0039C7412F